MLIFLAVLQTVPDELHDAARVDGATGWQRFRHVTLPAIGPAVILVSIVSMAGFFQLFAEPYVMTQGGPSQRTVTILYFMYEEGFKWWNLGSASAVAFVLFLCIFAVAMLQVLVGRRLGSER
jgi:multiple sugar transport system permease protein